MSATPPMPEQLRHRTGLQSNLLTTGEVQSRLYTYGSGRIRGTFLVKSIVSVLVRRASARPRSRATSA